MFRSKGSLSTTQLASRLGLRLEDFLAAKAKIEAEKGVLAFHQWTREVDPDSLEWSDCGGYWYSSEVNSKPKLVAIADRKW